jgi:putative ABC transport system permease protein
VRGVAAIATSVTLTVPAIDLMTFGAVSALLGTVGLAAGFFPVRRAAKADPLVALRHL